MQELNDHFSDNSEVYHTYRPSYPSILYESIYSHCKNFDVVWDCGTGNGQVAVELSKKFKKVYATDISANQLKYAPKLENIKYQLLRAEKTDFPSNFFDLICVAQAAHWFDIGKFDSEAKRVLKKEGVLAVWGYDLIRVNEEINTIIDKFYKNTVGPFWNKERASMENHYKDLVFSLKEIEFFGDISYYSNWNLEHFLGYISSWSAVKNYKSKKNTDPIIQLKDSLIHIWGTKTLAVEFPIFLRIFCKNQ